MASRGAPLIDLSGQANKSISTGQLLRLPVFDHGDDYYAIRPFERYAERVVDLAVSR
jgi:hypothetical protein